MCAFHSDMADTRTLGILTNITGGQYNTSVKSCTEACWANDFAYAGVEFTLECCTCFTCLFDELSSPDQTSLLKGVTILL
jgi:hypothetical protein